jgi:hypothetical protein
MAYESELEALPELEEEFEAELEDETEDEGEYEMEDEAGLEGEGWLGAIGNIASSLLGESEDEYEGEDEYEEEISPIRKIYPDALMEHLGELAAEAETEDEAAEHFLPLIGMAASKLLPVVAKAVVPMAKKALPRIAKALTKATPRLTRGVGRVAKVLHRNPQTRHLLKTVPAIARRTVGRLAHHAARGGHVTPRTAVRTLAKQARHVLGSPRQRAHALRRHNHLERRFHGRWGRGIARPHLRYGHAPQGAAPRYGRRVYGRAGAVSGVPRAAPGTHYPGGAVAAPAGRTGARSGSMVAGQCTCSACPTCGATTATQPAPTATAAPAPAYCRCCGQVIR